MSKLVMFPTPLLLAGDSILRLPEVKGRTGLSRSSIYAGAKAGVFPSPIKLGERAVGWTSSSIDSWLHARVHAASQKGAA